MHSIYIMYKICPIYRCQIEHVIKVYFAQKIIILFIAYYQSFRPWIIPQYYRLDFLSFFQGAMEVAWSELFTIPCFLAFSQFLDIFLVILGEDNLISFITFGFLDRLSTSISSGFSFSASEFPLQFCGAGKKHSLTYICQLFCLG